MQSLKNKLNEAFNIVPEELLDLSWIEESHDIEDEEELSEELEKALLEKEAGFRFSSNKKSFQESVSRMRKEYDNPKTVQEKKKRIKDWLVAAKQHKSKMDKEKGWED